MFAPLGTISRGPSWCPVFQFPWRLRSTAARGLGGGVTGGEDYGGDGQNAKGYPTSKESHEVNSWVAYMCNCRV